MLTKEIVVDGVKKIIVVKLPDDEYEDYIDTNNDYEQLNINSDTMDLSKIINPVLESNKDE